MATCGRVEQKTLKPGGRTTPPTLLPEVSRKSGQTLTEYAILAALVAIGVIVTVLLFGKVTLGVFAQIGSAMKRDAGEPDKKAVKEALSGMEVDAAITRNMRNFDQEDAGAPSPEAPATAPTPSPPQEYAGTHHIGNSGVPGTVNPNGNVINEGLTYTITFTVTPEMINYANHADGGALFLSFSAGNHVGDYNNFIDNEGVDTVLLDGQAVGYAVNGPNSLPLNVKNLSPGRHTVTFTSGELNTTRDDFNISDIVIGHSGR